MTRTTEQPHTTTQLVDNRYHHCSHLNALRHQAAPVVPEVQHQPVGARRLQPLHCCQRVTLWAQDREGDTWDTPTKSSEFWLLRAAQHTAPHRGLAEVLAPSLKARSLPPAPAR